MNKFENRYATSGIANEVGIDLQMLLWRIIDVEKENGKELDYLQSFTLSIVRIDGVVFQKVIQSQEVPKRSKTFLAEKIKQPLNRKIWVIDSNEYSTMMFPEEY